MGRVAPQTAPEYWYTVRAPETPTRYTHISTGSSYMSLTCQLVKARGRGTKRIPQTNKVRVLFTSMTDDGYLYMIYFRADI